MSSTLMDRTPVPPLDRAGESHGDGPSFAQVNSHNDAQNASTTGSSQSEPVLNAEHISAPLAPETPRESALSPFSEIFAGPEGLHPGARWLIYLALCYVTYLVLDFLTNGLRPDPAPLWWTMVTEARMMLAVILPAFAMARIEGRHFANFGLPMKQAFGRNFWAGTLWGIGSLTVLILALAATRAYSFGSLNIYGARIFKFAIYYAIFFLLTGLFEDFLLRGYSQWVLAQGMHFWPAAALLSILFGLLHLLNPGEARIGIVAVVAIGFFFCLTLRRTGTLWFAVGFHMAWDWGESFLYSVPDSGTTTVGHLLKSSLHGPDWLTGGTVGPEASYLLFLLIAGLWFLFSRTYPEVKYQVGKRISEVPPLPPPPPSTMDFLHS